MGDKLDNLTTRCRAQAALRRTREIPWEEQQAFLERHWQDFGDDYEQVVRRVRDGYARYRDDSFWYNKNELDAMEGEERCDMLWYGCLEAHQDEVSEMRRGPLDGR